MYCNPTRLGKGERKRGWKPLRGCGRMGEEEEKLKFAERKNEFWDHNRDVLFVLYSR